MSLEDIPFATAITDAVTETITHDQDPVGLQYMPQVKELDIKPHELADPIGDNAHSPVTGIVHRYPDRVLFKIANVCPVYCRFCFRKTMIGPGSDALGPAEREAALNYIGNTPDIWEVILTGGDPLILKPQLLKKIMTALNDMAHVKVIRIHTRVPVTDPSRINADLLAALHTHKSVYIVVHANHSQEFSDKARQAIAQISQTPIVMLSQSVLLKGVNDSVEALSELMKTFVENRIKPYYLHQLDPAPGTSHFHVPIETGRALVKALRGNISGLCQPTYMLDIPGGHGKSPLTSDYIAGDQIRNYQGELFPL